MASTAIKHTLAEYAAFTPDWDGEGAPSFKQETLENTERLIDALRDVAPEPDYVGPCGSGEIWLTWKFSNDRSIDFCVEEAGEPQDWEVVYTHDDRVHQHFAGGIDGLRALLVGAQSP